MTQAKLRGRGNVMTALLVLLLYSMISNVVPAPSPNPTTLTPEDSGNCTLAVVLQVDDRTWKQNQLLLEGTRHSVTVLRHFIDILPHDVKTKRITLDKSTTAETMKVAKFFLARWPLVYAKRPPYNRPRVEQEFDKLRLMVKDEKVVNRPMPGLAYQVARGVQVLAVDLISALIADVEAMQLKFDELHSTLTVGEFYMRNGTVRPGFSGDSKPETKVVLDRLPVGTKAKLMPLFNEISSMRQRAFGYFTSGMASALWTDVKALETIRKELVEEGSDSNADSELATPLLEQARLSTNVVMDTLTPILEFFNFYREAADEADVLGAMFVVKVVNAAFIENVTIPITNLPTPSSSSDQVPARRSRRSAPDPESLVSMDYDLPSSSFREFGHDGSLLRVVAFENMAP